MLCVCVLLHRTQAQSDLRTLLLLLVSTVANSQCTRSRYLRLSFLSFCRSQIWGLLDSRASHSDGTLSNVVLWLVALEQWHDGSGGSYSCSQGFQPVEDSSLHEAGQRPAESLQSQTSTEHGVAPLSGQGQLWLKLQEQVFVLFSVCD